MEKVRKLVFREGEEVYGNIHINKLVALAEAAASLYEIFPEDDEAIADFFPFESERFDVFERRIWDVFKWVPGGENNEG